MLEFVRRHTKLINIVLFLLVFPSFVLFGVAERFFEDNGKSEHVAQVDGHEITRAEWDTRHRRDADAERARNPSIDTASLDSDAYRYKSLEAMVTERTLAVEVDKEHILIADHRLLDMLKQDQNLAYFRTPDGKFDAVAFKRATGQTPQQYENRVSTALAMQEVLTAIANSAVAAPTQAQIILDALFDQREVQIARFDPASFKDKVQVSDADIQRYYKEHLAQFFIPEQVNIDYLVLDLNASRKRVTINEADVKTYYEQNRDRFSNPEQRRASHILIAVASSASPADRAKAKAKAEEILTQLRAKPNRFAELAHKNSQDAPSAAKGGQLDLVTRGAMPKSFDDALFSLKKGAISNVIQTDQGYNIIRLDDIEPAQTLSFEKVRTQIETQFRVRAAQQQFDKDADTLGNIVNQQPDSLQPAASQLGLTIEHANGVQRTPVPGATGALANRDFLSAVFAPDSLDRKLNTEAINLGSNQVAVGLVKQYLPARALSLEEAKNQVRALLMTERAADMARKEGQAQLLAWQAAPGSAKVGAPLVVSYQALQSQPVGIVSAALRADLAKTPAWVGADLGDQGYAVLRVNKSIPRDRTTPEQAQFEQAGIVQGIMASVEADAYLTVLKERLRAKILVPRPTNVNDGATAKGPEEGAQ
ncbi:MAG: SurA N-terminal domain-containing protein [Burkholderiaceae bacterium]|jgi:peptidyl-prolyl cis-trans isomerase D|nr:SurA N-terminal domain-containing protein [Burkholderiaceae bacterium]